MARKVFISFLGTNNYMECRYEMDGIPSEPVRFVQEALIRNICKEWSSDDRIFIFCTRTDDVTQGAYERNWVDNGQEYASTDTEKIGLEHRLKDLQEKIGLKAIIEEVDIKTGFSEDEIWNIFQTVYNKLSESDKIYFDVTHAFRSIPLFSTVLFNYSKFMKKTQLVSIKYGAFEQLGEAKRVRNIQIEKRIAPIIDLTNIARLQEYNQVASGLKDFGKVRQLKNAIAANLESSSDQTIRDLSKSISQLDEYIATIDLKEIKSGKFILAFRNNYKNAKKRKDISIPIRNILDELYKETEDFVGQNSYRNIEAAINWTIKHDMLMQAYPLAEEYVILRISDMFNEIKPQQLPQKKFRMFTSSILGMPHVDFIARNWKDTLADYPDVADEMADDPFVQKLRPLYAPIREARNSLAHGNGSIKYAQLCQCIPNIIDCICCLNKEYEEYPSTLYIKENII